MVSISKAFCRALLLIACMCLYFHWLHIHCVVAFIQPYGPVTDTKLHLSSSHAGHQKKRRQHGQKKSTRRQKKNIDKQQLASIDVNNLLSNMGLQQVDSNAVSNGTTLKNSKEKKRNKNGTARSERSGFPEIGLQTQLDYARNGHSVLRNFILDNDTENSQSSSSITNKRLMDLRRNIIDLAKDEELKAWVQKVEVAAGKKSDKDFKNSQDLVDACRSIKGCKKALRDMGVTASLPFLQYFNTWRKLDAVKDLAFDLGEAASILMDCKTVRLYQDAVFWKRSCDGPTPWHADARMAPFDTQNMITFWIPLQAVPSDGGTALMFCSKSHCDFALPYWNPKIDNDVSKQAVNAEDNKSISAWDRLEDRYPKEIIDYMPMSVGDVTVHSGWTLHCSNGNEGEGAMDRLALAITFVDGNAEIRTDWQTIGDDEDRWSYQDWCKDVIPQTKFSHELVPIVWPPQGL